MNLQRVCLAALLMLSLACCTSSNVSTICGTVEDAKYEGDTLALVDANSRDTIAFGVVKNGEWCITCPATGCPAWINAFRTSIALYIEKGDITADLFKREVCGTPLNDSLNAYNLAQNEIHQWWRDNHATQSRDMYTQMLNNLLTQTFENNKDNVFGAVPFEGLTYLIPYSQTLQLYRECCQEIKELPSIVKLMDELSRKDATSVGKMFTDFTIEHGGADSSAVSLSNYVGKGKYVLADFWASWCGSCREEIAYIARVYQKYHSDNFDVVSIAVGDKRENSLKAIEELGMTWNQIFDAGRIPGEIYGFSSIPKIILFGPDGTILARDLRGNAIEKAIEENLQQ